MTAVIVIRAAVAIVRRTDIKISAGSLGSPETRRRNPTRRLEAALLVVSEDVLYGLEGAERLVARHAVHETARRHGLTPADIRSADAQIR